MTPEVGEMKREPHEKSSREYEGKIRLHFLFSLCSYIQVSRLNMVIRIG